MDIIDTNGSGKIDYTEFLAAGFLDAKSFTIDRLKQAFAHFDTNDNGRISFEEVMEFMEDF
jgi:Ca2+-binding EF-hand superfamily protein